MRPLHPKELPEQRVAFRIVVRPEILGDALDFVNTFLRRLDRLYRQDVVFSVTFRVAGWSCNFDLLGHLFRADNVLVQACMAEKVRQGQVHLD